MRILITGGTGFIGSHLTNHFASEGHEVIVIGTKTEQPTKATKHIGLHLGGDFRKHFANLGDIDVCFHQAANNDTLDMDRDEMMFANVEAPMSLFRQLCSVHKCRKFIYASSSSVYGNSPAPYREDETVKNPLNPYAESKLEFDKQVMCWAETAGRPSVVGLRYTNVYGSGEEHKGRRASMIHQMAKIMRRGESPKLFWDGTQRRDWVYVKDVVRANVAALAYHGSGIFNCGSGRAHSFSEVMDVINRQLGSDIRPTWVGCPFQAAYQTYTEADMTKAKEVLGHVPAYGLERGIEDFLAE